MQNQQKPEPEKGNLEKETKTNDNQKWASRT
jgi:hypothetical protein